MHIRRSSLVNLLFPLILFVIYSLTAPQNHSEAEDVYDFARRVEQGSFADQAGVNRVLALPVFGVAYKAAQVLGYSGRAFPFMIFINRLLAVACVVLFWKLLSLSYRRHPACPEQPGTDSDGQRLDSDNNLAQSHRDRGEDGRLANRAESISHREGGEQKTEVGAAISQELQTSHDSHQPTTNNHQLPAALLLAFSYGFWRYANEAETYILATFFVLVAWVLVLGSSSLVPGRKAAGSGRTDCKESGVSPIRHAHSTSHIRHPAIHAYILCPLISAVGILVHLLNLVPLLLIIPLFYLLSKQWKRALLHGVLTTGFVVLGYTIFSPWLDWGELGAHHHRLEAGFGVGNLLRGAVAFGQNLVSGNFLFGFEGFREFLSRIFPSRMLDEEFCMAAHMPSWIPWVGGATVGVFVVCSLKFAVLPCKGLKTFRRQTSDGGNPESSVHTPKNQNPTPITLLLSSLIWLILYAGAVIVTEAGSPELWIMALIPFWMVAALLLQSFLSLVPGSSSSLNPTDRSSFLRHQSSRDERQVSGRVAANSRLHTANMNTCLWPFIILLFIHNLFAGLLPVMSSNGDYHVQKGAWVVENSSADDLILTDYEPVMIFYLDYYARGTVINSGAKSVESIHAMIDECEGAVYALNSFFDPMASMQVRDQARYSRMKAIGDAMQPGFELVEDDTFGGIYRLKR